MSFLSSMFNAAPAAATTQPAQQQQQQPSAEQQQQQQQQQPQSPLDNFAEIWQNPTNDENNATEQPASMFSVDPKELQAAVSKMNFLGHIPPKVQEALKAGGEDAVKANLYLMNQASQATFSQMMQATAKIVEAALAKQAEGFESNVSGVIRKNALQSGIADKNPMLAHPAAAPLIKSLEAQLLQKFPNASPQELTDMAHSYLTNFAEVVKPSKQTTQKSGRDDTDFSEFF